MSSNTSSCEHGGPKTLSNSKYTSLEFSDKRDGMEWKRMLYVSHCTATAHSRDFAKYKDVGKDSLLFMSADKLCIFLLVLI